MIKNISIILFIVAVLLFTLFGMMYLNSYLEAAKVVVLVCGVCVLAVAVMSEVRS